MEDEIKLVGVDIFLRREHLELESGIAYDLNAVATLMHLVSFPGIVTMLYENSRIFI